jgi:hypothetical protein
LYRFIRFFSQKLCICIALNDTFLSIAAQHWLGNSDDTVAMSYIKKGFQIYEEMRKYSTIFEEAVRLCNRSLLNFLTYKENLS